MSTRLVPDDKTTGARGGGAPWRRTALAIEGISHHYGARRALDSVSFTVAPASFTALLGLNSGGKSTLFSLILRGCSACRPGTSASSAMTSAATPVNLCASLGVVFQPRTLDLDLSVAQNLPYHAALQGIDRREARSRAADVLSRIGLADRSASKVRDLSGGQMRRLEVARALLHRPRLLLLDEATVGLDVKARAGILDHVRRLVAEQGVGVLWATPLLDEIGPDDDLVVLHQGRVLSHGQGRARHRRIKSPRSALCVHAADRGRRRSGVS